MQYTVKATAYAISYNKRESEMVDSFKEEFEHPREFYYVHEYAVSRRRQHVKDVLTHYGFGYTEALKILIPFIEKIPDAHSSWLK